MIDLRLNIVVVILMSVAATSSPAQNKAGSAYSMFGLGELQNKATIQSQGMGFTSIGLNSPYWANSINPAANTEVGGYYTHMFDFGIYYNQTTYTTSESSEKLSDGGLSQMNYWFRFNNKWTGIVGIAPFSKVGYSIQKNNVVSSQGNLYNVEYSGSGGLNEIYFGQGYEVLPNFTLGANLRFITGTILHQEEAVSTSSQESFMVSQRTYFHKLNLDFSLNYKVRREKFAVNIGAIYDNKTSLNGNATTQLSDIDEETIYEEIEQDNNYKLPQKAGLGISLVSNKFMLAADVEFNEWSKVEMSNVDKLNDTWRYAFGFEFTPNRQGLLYASNISYRLGYYIENSYLDIDDTSFDKWGITGGLGLPLKTHGAINISYHRKFNGTTNNSLIYETTNEINLGISIRDLWFARKKIK